MSHLTLLLTSCFCAAASAVAQNAEFTLRGHVPGLKPGIEVALMSNEDNGFENLATATVGKGGRFELRGHVEHPVLCTLTTNNLNQISKEVDRGDYKHVHWTYTPVFVDNVDMQVSCPKYSLWNDAPISDNFRISGGQVQEDFNDYNLMLAQCGLADMWTADPERLDSARLSFIESHPTSVVSVKLAAEKLVGGYNLKADEIKHLQETLTGCPADTARYASFQRSAELALLTANGNPLVDLDLVTPSGERCQLSDVARGREGLLLIDFWASWCGICRASTPEIVELYNQYPRQQFDVISVSSDEKSDAWQQAMDKDRMPWAQYCLTKQGFRDFFEKYQITGVPYYLLVNSDGRVIGSPARVSSIKEVIEAMKNK